MYMDGFVTYWMHSPKMGWLIYLSILLKVKQMPAQGFMRKKNFCLFNYDI